MTVLVFLESAFLIVLAITVWRRSRPESPPYSRAIGLLIVSLVVQVGVLAITVPIATWLEADPDAMAQRAPLAALGVAGVYVLRVLVLTVAVWAWLSISRDRLRRSWRGVAILICMVGIVFAPSATTGLTIAMVLPMWRLKWTEAIHGWRRLGLLFMFALLGVLLFAKSSDLQITDHSGEVPTARTVSAILSDLPGATGSIQRLSAPWGHAARASLHLLHMQIVVAFFQLLVLPIRLRGLSLKRRFTVTLAMYRFIPGALTLIFMTLALWLGIGLHRAGMVKESFNTTLDEGLRVTETMLGTLQGPAGERVLTPTAVLAAADRWVGSDERNVVAIVRDLERAAGEAADESDDERWTTAARIVSPDAPPSLVHGHFFGEAPYDSSAGIVLADGHLYLRAARAHHRDDTATLAEVFVRLDSLYLQRVANRIQSDLSIDVTPNVHIGTSSVVVGGDDDAWADTTFTLSAPFTHGREEHGLWDQKLYLARSFIPVGNWMRALGENNTIGAVQLKLRTSPHELVRSITSNTLALTSNAFVIVIFLGIAVVFGLVEFSAVRTGRSIIRGIVDDAKQLSIAARRFGEGDLTHRVPVTGKDEFGRLAATFNSMAANIEEHQGILLKKERLEADLALAREIQQRMLPQGPPTVPGLDVAGLSIPSREVGGDLFYFLPISEGRLGVTIGDVSGKSVPAALLMSNVLAALKTEARLVDEEDQILAHLNRLILEQVEPGRFVTFFYGVLDPRRHRLRYASAGHNPPLLVHQSGETEWLQEGGVPLGVLAEHRYAPAEINLHPGDVLVLYSDGVTEAEKPVDPPPDESETDDLRPVGEFFDEHRLEETARRAREGHAAEIIKEIVDGVSEFTGGADLADDLTLVVVKVAPHA